LGLTDGPADGDELGALLRSGVAYFITNNHVSTNCQYQTGVKRNIMKDESYSVLTFTSMYL
jgi:hypothetical protein